MPSAMDELEHQLKDEINTAEREASAKFAALEKKAAAAEADLTKTNEVTILHVVNLVDNQLE